LDESDDEKDAKSSPRYEEEEVSSRNGLVVLDTPARLDGEARSGLEGRAIGTAVEVAVEPGEEESEEVEEEEAQENTESVGTAGAEFRLLRLGPRDGRRGDDR
jgi:hypothetical protein